MQESILHRKYFCVLKHKTQKCHTGIFSRPLIENECHIKVHVCVCVCVCVRAHVSVHASVCMCV